MGSCLPDGPLRACESKSAAMNQWEWKLSRRRFHAIRHAGNDDAAFWITAAGFAVLTLVFTA